MDKTVSTFTPFVIESIMNELPEKILSFGIKIVLAIAVLLIGMQFTKFLRKFIRKSLTKANADIGVIQFLDSFIKIGMYVLIVIIAATGFGVNVTSIVAILGSAGVAIGLALQGSLSNLAGGVLILVLKPFKVGDYIIEHTNNNEGTVTEIQIFYTKLTTGDNRIIILPNGTLANSSLTNVTQTPYRRLDLYLTISYENNLQKVKEELEKILLAEYIVLKDKDIKVYIDLLGEIGVKVGIRCWLLKEDYWEGKCRLLEAIKEFIDREDISLPLAVPGCQMFKES